MMKLFVTIIFDMNKVDEIMTSFNDSGIHGSTIINASGMASILLKNDLNTDDLGMFGTLRQFLNPKSEEHALILTVLEEKMVKEAVKAVEEVVGDLDKPGTGICFSLDLDFVKGVSHE